MQEGLMKATLEAINQMQADGVIGFEHKYLAAY